jgi:hypothetical protein
MFFFEKFHIFTTSTAGVMVRALERFHRIGWSSWTWLVFPGHFGHGLTLETSRLV